MDTRRPRSPVRCAFDPDAIADGTAIGTPIFDLPPLQYEYRDDDDHTV